MTRTKISALIIALAATVIFTIPALAITPTIKLMRITNNGDTPLDYGSYLTNFPTQTLVEEGKLGADGLDARITSVSGGDPLPMMLTNNKVLTVASLSSYGTASLYFTTNHDPASSMPIIVGNLGYFTTADNPDIELGNTFTLTIIGLFNTGFETSVHDYIMDKDKAFRIYIYDDQTIRAAILDRVSGAEVCTATISGVDTNEHTLVVSGDGSKLSISVDGGEAVVSDEPIGDGVPDNSNPITWDTHNVMPYILGIELDRPGSAGGETYGLSYSATSYSQGIHPYTWVGQTFTPTVSGAARALRVTLSRGSQTSGTITAALYEPGSEGGVSSITPWFSSPPPLLTKTLNTSTLPSTPAEVTFYWPGYHNLIAGHQYFIVLSTDGPYPGQVQVEATTDGTYTRGAMWKFSADADPDWIHFNSENDDMLFAITSEEVPFTSPTHITNAAGLQAMNEDLTGNYVLDNDINLAGLHFVPIGDSNNAGYFTGKFDGQGHTISNMTVDNTSLATGAGPTDGMYGAGLFGDIGDDAVLRNFKLTNANVTLNFNPLPDLVNIGLVIGECYPESGDGHEATISNIQVDGAITITHASGYFSPTIGGFGGYLYHANGYDLSVDSDISIDNNSDADNFGAVNGGFAGYWYQGILQRASATGSITSDIASIPGSFFNDSDSAFVDGDNSVNDWRDCYARETLTGVGYSSQVYMANLWSNDAYTGTIAQAYTASTISGGAVVSYSPGVYFSYSGTADNVFWDDTIQTIAPANQKPTGADRTTSQLHTQTTFSYFDFEYVWNIVEGNYPTLRQIVNLPNPPGGGSAPVTMLTYQPNTIIQGNVLPDLQGNQDAVIHWGVNDPNTAFSEFVTPTAPAVATPGSPGAGPGIGGGTQPITKVQTGTWTLPSLNPPLIGDLINDLLDSTVFGRAFFWYPVALLTLLLAKFWAYRLTFSLFMKMLSGLVAVIALCAISLLPWLSLPLFFIWDFTIMTHSQRGAL